MCAASDKLRESESGQEPEGLHECALNNLAQSCEGKAKVKQHGPVYGVFLNGMFDELARRVPRIWIFD